MWVTRAISILLLRLVIPRYPYLPCMLRYSFTLVCKHTRVRLLRLIPAFILSTRKRGLRKSRPRQCLSGILILMLALGTAHVILVVQFYIVQLSSAMSEGILPALKRLLGNYNTALDWSLRLNVSIRFHFKAITFMMGHPEIS